ncbi:hypothetical protein MHYP_G00349970, partial [Metynnis hypsauchen]
VTVYAVENYILTSEIISSLLWRSSSVVEATRNALSCWRFTAHEIMLHSYDGFTLVDVENAKHFLLRGHHLFADCREPPSKLYDPLFQLAALC